MTTSTRSRVVAITGGARGIGYHTARELIGRGHRVAIGDIDEIQLKTAAEELGVLVALPLDVTDPDSFRAFLDATEAELGPLEVLINNAGVMPDERRYTPAGFELTFATNVLGPFLLTEMLMPLLEKSGDGRVITMSSGGMYSSGFSLRDPQLEEKDYNPTGFYAHTKRAEVMLTDEWADRAGADGPRFFSMHPGWAVTPGMSAALPLFHKVTGPILRDTAEGADTAVWLCAAGPEEAPAGEFFMDRKARPKHRIPSTRESAGDRRDLYELCSRLVGIAPD